MKKVCIAVIITVMSITNSAAQTAGTTPNIPGSFPENSADRKEKRQINATITRNTHDTVKANR